VRFHEACLRLLQFEAVRGACSRRWQIADALVMCTELDLTSYSALAVSPLHSLPRRRVSFLQISFIRSSDSGDHVWMDYDGADGDPLTATEQGVAATYRGLILEWLADGRAGLPPSTAGQIGRPL